MPPRNTDLPLTAHHRPQRVLKDQRSHRRALKLSSHRVTGLQKQQHHRHRHLRVSQRTSNQHYTHAIPCTPPRNCHKCLPPNFEDEEDWPGAGGRLRAPNRGHVGTCEDEDEEDWPGAGGRLQAPTRGQYTLGTYIHVNFFFSR